MRRKLPEYLIIYFNDGYIYLFARTRQEAVATDTHNVPDGKQITASNSVPSTKDK